MDGSVRINKRNLSLLAIEMMKIMKRDDPFLVNKMFPLDEENGYQLQHCTDFVNWFVNSSSSGIESLSYLGTNLQEMLPLDLKQIESLSEFITIITKGNPHNCL